MNKSLLGNLESSSDQLFNRLTPQKRIYLSRQKLPRRKISNGEEVESLLCKHGFTSISPQEHDISMIEQLIKTSQIVIGANGAALCNTIFSCCSDQKTAIIYPISHIDNYYFRVTNSLGRKFYGMQSNEIIPEKSLGEMINAYYYPSLASNYNVNLSRLSIFLDFITS